MTERLEMYKCNVCGNIAEVVISAKGELVCCSQPMENLKSIQTLRKWPEKNTYP